MAITSEPIMCLQPFEIWEVLSTGKNMQFLLIHVTMHCLTLQPSYLLDKFLMMQFLSCLKSGQKPYDGYCAGLFLADFWHSLIHGHS